MPKTTTGTTRDEATTENTATTIRSYLDALLSGDLERIRNHFTDDATWTIHGNLPLSGSYHGAEAIMTFLATAMGQLFTPDTQRFTFTNTYVDGDTAVVEWNVTGIGTAAALHYDNDYCGIFVIPERQIHAVREYLDSDHVRQVLFTS